jgi:hypothetical protein
MGEPQIFGAEPPIEKPHAATVMPSRDEIARLLEEKKRSATVTTPELKQGKEETDVPSDEIIHEESVELITNQVWDAAATKFRDIAIKHNETRNDEGDRYRDNSLAGVPRDPPTGERDL